MTIFYVCTQGHEWPAAQPPLPGQLLVCPTCGSFGSLRQPVPVTEKFDPASATLAPNPRAAISSFPALELDIVAHSPTTEYIPEFIGPYRVVEQLGRGGMGVVYKARQPGLDRFVAVKVIIAGKFSSAQIVSRFRQEADAVSRLQHTNFVQIYEIGEQEGRPFLVLEFVDGSSLAHLRGQPVPANIAARLTLVLSRAIAHAHRRGIVHRDLTPANVLLAWPEREKNVPLFGEMLARELPSATPKITDFGLAKRLDVSSAQTEAGTVMGTPSYMAPEQAGGLVELAGPSCDIYALGAVLYELLTGRPPFLAATTVATLEQVMHQDPVPPRQLQPGVARDLETICLKCLEKSPQQRYATADELADDLERFVQQKPIQARRATAAARVFKWMRRKPAVAALIGVSVLALASLFVGSQWYSALVRNERNLAEDNLRLALVAVDQMLNEVGEQQLAYEPRMERKRRALLGRALELYQEFLTRRGSDRRLKVETAHAYRRLGDIERWLGNLSESRKAYEQAIRMFGQLHQETAAAEYQRWQANCLNFLAESLRLLSQPQPAKTYYEQAILLQDELVLRFPQDSAYKQELARTNYNLGILYREINQLRSAEKALTRAGELLQTLVNRKPKPAEYRQELARVNTNLGTVLRATNRQEQAVFCYTLAIQALDELRTEHSERPDYRYELGIAHANRGNAQRDCGRTTEAQQDYQIAQQELLHLVADFPAVPTFLQELANTENSLAAALIEVQGPTAAETVWLNACDHLRKLNSLPGALPAYQADLGLTLGNLGWLYLENGDAPKALEQLQEAVTALEQALVSNPSHPDYCLALRSQYQNLAEAALRLNDYTTAANAATRLPLVAGASAEEKFSAACLLIRAGMSIRANPTVPETDRVAQADSYYAQAVQLLRSLDSMPAAQQVRDAQPVVAPALEQYEPLSSSFAQLLNKVQDPASR